MGDGNSKVRARGRCICGSVRYEVRGPLRDVAACHCTECRRATGSIFHATVAWRDDVTIHDNGRLAWYQSSYGARRGFCSNCGSNLFFDGHAEPYLAITAGSLETPTGLDLKAHIYVTEKADYYAIDDGLPQHDQHGHGLTIPEA